MRAITTMMTALAVSLIALCSPASADPPMADKPAKVGSGRALHESSEDTSWVGKLVVTKKPGVQLVDMDEAGIWHEVGSLGNEVARVDEDDGARIKVRTDRGAGWLSKDDALRLQDAIPYFTERIRHNPRDARAYGMRAVALLYTSRELSYFDPDAPARRIGNEHQDEFERVIKDCGEALRLEPDSADWHIARGRAHLHQLAFGPAIRDFDQAIRIHPDDADLFHDRGCAYCAQKDYARAIEDFDRCIRLKPKYVMAIQNRGAAYAKKGDYGHAVQDLDEALRLHPKDASVFRACAKRALRPEQL